MKRCFIAREGLLLGGVPFMVGLFFLWIGIWNILGIVLCLIGIFVLFFFRYPDRKPVSAESEIYAPADGKIIRIREQNEDVFFEGLVHKISIFMNLLNVHITYAPINGKVEYLRYNPGRFVKAGQISNSLEETNENNFIGIRNGNGRIALCQVAGYIARRIVCDVKLGDELRVGERIGMIKFGSRIDVYLPKKWDIVVKEGEHTKAGRTVLAKEVATLRGA